MAAEPRNAYIFGAVTDNVEIQTANLGFSTMASSIKGELDKSVAK